MKIHRFLLVVWSLLLFFVSPAYSISPTDSLLQELNKAIDETDHYIKIKETRVQELRNKLNANSTLSASERFNLFNQLYQEYRSYKYDSAFAYALKLQTTAHQLKDPVKVSYSKLKLSFILLSSGMFKEAFDSLSTVNLKNLPDSLQVDYYEQMSRACYDLADYNMDTYYASYYLERGNQYGDSAIALSRKDGIHFFYLRGRKYLKEKKLEKAKADFQQILHKLDPSSQKFAMIAASYAIAHQESGEMNKAIDLMIKAAIADIKSSTTEATALMKLSEWLFRMGDIGRAYTFIKQALEDADFYGAKQRQIQASAILPIIEGEQFERLENERRRLFAYAIAVSILSLLVVIFAYIIFKQLKQLRIAKRTVMEANQSLQETNFKLQQTNEVLQLTNAKLLEANRIKEECIAYSFNIYTEYIETLDKLKNGIQRKLVARKYDEIIRLIESINMKKERENLYKSFDKTFLRLFPDFIMEFNSFFKEDDRFLVRDKDSLSSELRIFALIRMGISDHEQIARMLEYSVRTIYNYKSKIKNKSILSNEEFEQKVMEIKAF